MPVLTFGPHGDLPIGIHGASLADVVALFGTGSRRRSLLADRLKRIYRLARATGQLRRFILFGSFVTRKTEPGDIDIFLIMDNAFDVTKIEDSARAIFDHAVAQAEWDASVFWARQEALLTSEEEAIAYWQIKRDRNQRGIIEVLSE